MKKPLLLPFLVFICCVFSPSLYSDNTTPNDKKVVNNINHKTNQIVINDKIYDMPINLDVYIFEAKKRIKRKVNRYALKAGQVVFFSYKVRNKQAYIEKLTIFQP